MAQFKQSRNIAETCESASHRSVPSVMKLVPNHSETLVYIPKPFCEKFKTLKVRSTVPSSGDDIVFDIMQCYTVTNGSVVLSYLPMDQHFFDVYFDNIADCPGDYVELRVIRFFSQMKYMPLKRENLNRDKYMDDINKINDTLEDKLPDNIKDAVVISENTINLIEGVAEVAARSAGCDVDVEVKCYVYIYTRSLRDRVKYVLEVFESDLQPEDVLDLLPMNCDFTLPQAVAAAIKCKNSRLKR